MRYRERVTVQQATRTRGERGGVVDTFANVDGLESVPATISQIGWTNGSNLAWSMNRSDMTVVQDQFAVVLSGDHPEVEPGMRILARDGEYEVVAAGTLLGRDSTLLTCRRTDPQGVPA